MTFPDIDKDFIVMESKKHGLLFNLQSTIDHKEFVNYYRLREKAPSWPFTKYSKMFGKDLIKHFEIAYQTLLVLETKDEDFEL